MKRYYTRACNFYYGSESKALLRKKKSLPLNGNNEISFDNIEIITRKSKKKISINRLNELPRLLKKKNNLGFKEYYLKKKKFCKFRLSKDTKYNGCIKPYS